METLMVQKQPFKCLNKNPFSYRFPVFLSYPRLSNTGKKRNLDSNLSNWFQSLPSLSQDRDFKKTSPKDISIILKVLIVATVSEPYQQQPSTRVKARFGWSKKHWVLFHPLLKWSESGLVMSESVMPWTMKPVRLLCLWNSPGKNTGVGCHSLLQGLFPCQGWNLGLLHCEQILYCMSHKECPHRAQF